jgi:hypothetical protein
MYITDSVRAFEPLPSLERTSASLGPTLDFACEILVVSSWLVVSVARPSSSIQFFGCVVLRDVENALRCAMCADTPVHRV